MFSAGTFGSRLIVNLCGSEVRALQMNSAGALEPRTKLQALTKVSADVFRRGA
jgi:hypothetical protein